LIWDSADGAAACYATFRAAFHDSFRQSNHCWLNAELMKFLIDTNIVVPLEPRLISDFEINTDHALEFYRLTQKSGNIVYVHPAIEFDLKRDKNTERSTLRRKLINRYDKIESPPPLSLLQKAQVGDPIEGSNDYVDNCLLASVKGDAVDFLVTEDKKLHRKAQRSGLESRVFFLKDAIALLLDLFDKSPPPPPAVKKVFVYELDEKDPIFKSLRQDYSPNFDSWLQKCKRNHREAYVIYNEKIGLLSGICIIKKEKEVPDIAKGKTLKLCTFKISEMEFGNRYGELLFKTVFDYADNNNYHYIYFTAFPKQDDLIAFSESFGFCASTKPINYDELIVYKKLIYSSEDIVKFSPLEFNIRYGPRRILFKGNNSFLVPIKPIFHIALFPELGSQIPMFHETRPCGNSIKKAYLCHSPNKHIKSGDNILFYRSEDVKGITAIGAIEDILRTANPNAIARHVGSRTVYSFDRIAEFCKKPTLAIRFRYVRGLETPIQLNELKKSGVIKGAPQSIMKLKQEGVEWIKKRLSM
jgi:hypothetical protein